MEWQPIKTIPQEKAVDVWIVSEGNPGYGRRGTHVCLVGNEWFGTDAPDRRWGEYATHWMPLPAPPSEA